MIRSDSKALLTGTLLILMSVFANAQSTIGTIPASAIAESIRGSVLIGGNQAKKHQVFLASGTVVKTGEESFAAIVLSNGLSIYCGPESQLEIVKASQDEVLGFYAGGDFEEVVSTIQLKLIDGEFGFNQPEPNPTSKLRIQTRFGEIEGDAGSFSIIINGRKGKAATLNGSLYFMSAHSKRRFVAEDEMLDLAMAANEGTAMALTPLRATGRLTFRPLVERARLARDRILVQVVDGEATFQIVRTPASLDGPAFNDYRLPK